MEGLEAVRFGSREGKKVGKKQAWGLRSESKTEEIENAYDIIQVPNSPTSRLAVLWLSGLMASHHPSRLASQPFSFQAFQPTRRTL